MSARRLLATAVAIAWFAPAAMAGAVVLHVALDHHGDENHGAPSHPIDLLEAAAHGHAHSASEADHHHSAASSSAEVASRRSLESKSIQDRSTEAGVEPAWALDPVLQRRIRPPAEPPRACGPPLLARLSTLRI